MKTERKGSWKNTTEKITSACVILNGIFVVYDIPTAVSFRPILQYRVECEIGVTARSRAHWQMPSILFSFFDRGAKAFSLYRSSPLRPPPHDLSLSVVLRFVYGLLSLIPPSHPDPVKDSRTREPPEIMRKCRKPPCSRLALQSSQTHGKLLAPSRAFARLRPFDLNHTNGSRIREKS